MDNALQEIYKSALIRHYNRSLDKCIKTGNNEYTVTLLDYQLDVHFAEYWVSKIALSESGVTPHWNIDRRLA